MTAYGIYLDRAGHITRLHASRHTLQLLLADLHAFTPDGTRILGVVITSR